MKKILLFVFSSILALGSVSAQIVFSNPITGTNPNTSNPYTIGQTVSSGITVSGIGRGLGISGNAANNRYNANSFNTDTLDLTAYFEFVITPNTMPRQVKIDFTTFTYTGQASGTGPTKFAFRSSVNGFMSDIATPPEAGATINLSGLNYQNIITPITFRLYGFDASAVEGTFSVNDFSFGGVLPIELISFDAKALSTDVTTLLSFTTATELNNAYFAIERSSDGRAYEQIGEVKGAGTSYVQQDYTFTDEKPLRGINYYRLKQVDLDGQFTYSSVVSVQFGKAGNVVIYPTPATETVNVRLEESLAADAQWQIVDMTGRVLSEGVFAAEQLQYSLPVGNLTQGAYILRMTAEQVVLTQQFRKQ